MSLPRLLIIILFKRRGDWNQAPFGLLCANVLEFYGSGPERVRVVMFFCSSALSFQEGWSRLTKNFGKFCPNFSNIPETPSIVQKVWDFFLSFCLFFFSPQDKFDYQSGMQITWTACPPHHLLISAGHHTFRNQVEHSWTKDGTKPFANLCWTSHVSEPSGAKLNQGRNQAIC